MPHSHRARAVTFLILLPLVMGVIWACNSSGLQATPTPTKTPRPAAIAPSATPMVLLLTVAPPTEAAQPTATPWPTEVPPSEIPPLPTETPLPISTPVPATRPPAQPAATRAPSPTPLPQVDFTIAELRVLGLGENNGGIEAGGLRNIYITVVDAAGNPIDGAVIVNTAPYPGRVVSGDKGPGKAEILMDKEEFRLTVESVNGAPVRSETTHTLSLINPVPADIAGKLGDACPTADNCPLPPYKHFSYVLTFRRTY